MSIATQLDTLRQLRRFETLVKDDDYNRIARERMDLERELLSMEVDGVTIQQLVSALS